MAICNPLWSYGCLKSQDMLKFCEKFSCFFLEKTTLTVKFSEFYSVSFHRHTDQRACVCSNFVKFGRWEISKICQTFAELQQFFDL